MAVSPAHSRGSGSPRPAFGPRLAICQNSHWSTSTRPRSSRDRTCRSCGRDIAGSRRTRRSRSACRPGPSWIDDRRHAVVGRDRQKLRLELIALGDVDRDHGVGQPALLEHDRDLPAVRRRPVIEVDRRLPLAGCLLDRLRRAWLAAVWRPARRSFADRSLAIRPMRGS